MSGEATANSLSEEDLAKIRSLISESVQNAITAETSTALKDDAKQRRDIRIKHYEVLRDYAKHEDILVNNRVTWILTIHGFLYATYGFTLQKKVEVIEKLQAAQRQTLEGLDITDLVLMSTEGPVLHALRDLDLFMLIIASVGAVVSGLGVWSISAAKSSVINVKKIFEKKVKVTPRTDELGQVADFDDFLVPTIAGGGRRFATWAGSSASVLIPVFLAISWVVAICIQNNWLSIRNIL
jgi:hypothetical protein